MRLSAQSSFNLQRVVQAQCNKRAKRISKHSKIVRDWHLAHPGAKPNYESSIPEWIWGLAQDSALSAATINFSREEVALSASSPLSPLLEVYFQ